MLANQSKRRAHSASAEKTRCADSEIESPLRSCPTPKRGPHSACRSGKLPFQPSFQPQCPPSPDASGERAIARLTASAASRSGRVGRGNGGSSGSSVSALPSPPADPARIHRFNSSSAVASAVLSGQPPPLPPPQSPQAAACSPAAAEKNGGAALLLLLLLLLLMALPTPAAAPSCAMSDRRRGTTRADWDGPRRRPQCPLVSGIGSGMMAGRPLRGRMVLVAGWRAYYMYELVPLPCGRTTVGRPVHQPWYAVGAGA
jgi:hypothetical protein